MKILITRPVEDGLRTCARLQAMGHQTVLAPIARIEPTHEPVPVARADALLATSANALRMLDPATCHRLANIPIFCVGQKTATEARQRGFSLVHRGDGDGRALVDLVSSQRPRPNRLIYLTGTPRKPFVEEALRARSLPFTTVELYKTVADPLWPHDLSTEIPLCTAAMHFSRASADMVLQAVDLTGLSASFAAMTHLCLSEDVAAPLVHRGFRAVHYAATPTEDAMIALMIRVNET